MTQVKALLSFLFFPQNLLTFLKLAKWKGVRLFFPQVESHFTKELHCDILIVEPF